MLGAPADAHHRLIAGLLVIRHIEGQPILRKCCCAVEIVGKGIVVLHGEALGLQEFAGDGLDTAVRDLVFAQRDEPNSRITFWRNGELIRLQRFDQRDRPVRRLFMPALRGDFFRQGRFEADLCFQRQDPRDRFIQALRCQPPVPQRGEGIAVVLFKIRIEHQHVAAGHNGCGNGLPTGHGHAVAAHDGGVAGDEAVEAQPPAQHVRQQRFAQARGQGQFLVRQVGVCLLGHVGLADMAHHDAQKSLPDQIAVHRAVAFVPPLGGQGVIGGVQMLIPIVHPVAGEMLGAGGHPAALYRGNIVCRHLLHSLWVRAEGTDVCNGV